MCPPPQNKPTERFILKNFFLIQRDLQLPYPTLLGLGSAYEVCHTPHSTFITCTVYIIYKLVKIVYSTSCTKQWVELELVILYVARNQCSHYP